jgi:hypothetical protein
VGFWVGLSTFGILQTEHLGLIVIGKDFGVVALIDDGVEGFPAGGVGRLPDGLHHRTDPGGFSLR